MHRIGNRRHQVRKNRQTVQLFNVLLNVPGAHAARVERDDFVVKSRKAAFVLLNQLRFESAVPVPRNRQRHRAILRQHPLAAATVTVITGCLLVFTVQMHVHLGIQHALGQRLLQITE